MWRHSGGVWNPRSEFDALWHGGGGRRFSSSSSGGGGGKSESESESEQQRQRPSGSSSTGNNNWNSNWQRGTATGKLKDDEEGSLYKGQVRQQHTCPTGTPTLPPVVEPG